ncbi:MAG: DUF1707 domain-containing protein [Dactylosporangium sp.]|nr:DUF1707 domain-containing protein [Dactylosporangium sp.]NNJ63661.1 DUF1707 domain-containing protein [Dactylosporangium sp.]
MRAADVDRAFVTGLLKKAVDEGRLTLTEYDERLRATYAAQTYGDLDVLLRDLPAGIRQPASNEPASPAPTTRVRDPAVVEWPGRTAAKETPLAGMASPRPGPVAGPVPATPSVASVFAAEAAEFVASRRHRRIPKWLIVVWGTWLSAVSINLVIWLLVSITASGGPVYFWPMWVAGPWGTALVALTIMMGLLGASDRE